MFVAVDTVDSELAQRKSKSKVKSPSVGHATASQASELSVYL